MAVDTFGGMPRFGHYVIGAPLPGKEILHAASVDPVSGSESLRAVCLRLGFGILETQAAGDCGTDTMCFHTGTPRNAAEFKKVRAQLSAFIESRSGDAAWQECFQACGESAMSPVARKDSSSCGGPPSRKPTLSASKKAWTLSSTVCLLR